VGARHGECTMIVCMVAGLLCIEVVGIVLDMWEAGDHSSGPR
jgi:hypothetical protein